MQDISGYLSERRILIVDPSPQARSAVLKTFKTLGARTSSIVGAGDLASAVAEIEKSAPEIILCEYNLESQCGIQLVRLQKERIPDPDARLFVMVTGNSRESAIAEAAEEEVDGYILKPYTMALLQEYVVRYILAKIVPSPYRKALSDGKAELATKDLATAEARFRTALRLSEKPALAHYYLGQVEEKRRQAPEAEQEYRLGLGFNEYHYRCLVGVFELCSAQGRLDEAYKVGKKIVMHFPLSPQRLDSVLRLAVRTRTYDEIDLYYDIYTKVDYRTPELSKCMAAALVVAGKNALLHRSLEAAVEYFRKAVLTAGRGALGIRRESVVSLVEAGAIDAAEGLIRDTPPELQASPSYLAMDLLVAHRVQSGAVVVDRARKLRDKGVQDPLIHEILIRRSVEAGLAQAADDVFHEAVKLWPQLRAQFEAALREGGARAPGASAGPAPSK